MADARLARRIAAAYHAGVPDDGFNSRNRYHRQMLLPGIGEEGQQRLESAHVLIVGCGAPAELPPRAPTPPPAEARSPALSFEAAQAEVEAGCGGRLVRAVAFGSWVEAAPELLTDGAELDAPHDESEVELYSASDGQIRVRFAGKGEIGGKPFTGSHPITAGALVRCGQTSFVLQPWHA